MDNIILLIVEFFKTGLFAVGGGLATIPFLSEMGVKDLYVEGRKVDSNSGNIGQSLKQATEDFNVIYENPNISDLDSRIEEIFDRRYEEIGDNVKIKDFEKMGCNILITKMYDKYIHIEFCKDRKLLVSFNKGGTGRGSAKLRAEDYSGWANEGHHHFIELDDPSYKYIKSYKVDPISIFNIFNSNANRISNSLANSSIFAASASSPLDASF